MKDDDGEKRWNTSARDFICVEGNLKFLNAAKSIDHDETRTRNLLIRSQTPYPLGHAVVGIKILKMVFKGIQSLRLIFFVYIKSWQYSMFYTNKMF